ncbi:MAG TPA: UbiA family prenyltransferase, partial [Rhizomicrobium sp.]|nr:UbiA family prenyltransferase [Rhizomicrobium sp.]
MSLADTIAVPRVTTVGDFFALLKPRVMSLVVVTALAGIVAAPGHVHLLTAFTALLCITVGAGASGALNMAYDSDIDGLMTRTATRPIPLGHIAREDALGFGWTLAVTSVATMWLFVGVPAAALLAFTIFFYVVVYTLWLKRRTPQNI